MNTKLIKEFKFDKAQYIVSDGNGGRVFLRINYMDNSFNVVKKHALSDAFEKELTNIAQDLLKRKHDVNFAEIIKV